MAPETGLIFGSCSHNQIVEVTIAAFAQFGHNRFRFESAALARCIFRWRLDQAAAGLDEPNQTVSRVAHDKNWWALLCVGIPTGHSFREDFGDLLDSIYGKEDERP